MILVVISSILVIIAALNCNFVSSPFSAHTAAISNIAYNQYHLYSAADDSKIIKWNVNTSGLTFTQNQTITPGGTYVSNNASAYTFHLPMSVSNDDIYLAYSDSTGLYIMKNVAGVLTSPSNKNSTVFSSLQFQNDGTDNLIAAYPTVSGTSLSLLQYMAGSTLHLQLIDPGFTSHIISAITISSDGNTVFYTDGLNSIGYMIGGIAQSHITSAYVYSVTKLVVSNDATVLVALGVNMVIFTLSSGKYVVYQIIQQALIDAIITSDNQLIIGIQNPDVYVYQLNKTGPTQFYNQKLILKSTLLSPSVSSYSIQQLSYISNISLSVVGSTTGQLYYLKCCLNPNTNQNCQCNTDPNLDPSTGCVSCLPAYFLNYSSNKCICSTDPYMNQTSNCTACNKGYAINTTIGLCKCSPDPYKDQTNSCNTCKVGYAINPLNLLCQCSPDPYKDPTTGCLTCLSKYALNTTGMCTCSTDPNLDPATSCIKCKTGYGMNTTVNLCKCSPDPYRDQFSNCSICKVGYTLNTTINLCKCTILYKDETTGCANCKSGYLFNSTTNYCACYPDQYRDPTTGCTVCKYGYAINSTLNLCRCYPDPYRDEQTSCLLCKSGYAYNATLGLCKCSPDPNKDQSSGCTLCKSLFRLVNGVCQCALDPYMDPSTNCTICLSGYTLNTTLLLCKCYLDPYKDQTTGCVSCKAGYSLNSIGKCKCYPDAYLDESTGCTTCKYGYFYDYSSGLCQCSASVLLDQTTSCVLCKDKNADPSNNCSCYLGFILNSNNLCISIPIAFNVTSSGQIYYQINTIQQTQDFIYLILNTFNFSSSNISSLQVYLNFRNSKNRLLAAGLNVQILSVNIISSSQVEFKLANPPYQVSDNILYIATTSSVLGYYTIHQLLSSSQLSSLAANQYRVETVFVPILMIMFTMLSILGYKSNHAINMLQKVSFLRYNLTFSTYNLFAVLYNLRFSCFQFGPNLLSESLPQNYLEYSNGLFYIMDKDANVLRNCGICLIIAIWILIARVCGIAYFQKTKTLFRLYYFRLFEILDKMVMFPLVFYSIGVISFSVQFGSVSVTTQNIYLTSLGISGIVIIYYVLVNIVYWRIKQMSNHNRLEYSVEFIMCIVESFIILQTIFTSRVLLLIVVTVVRGLNYFLLNRKYHQLTMKDLFKLVSVVFEVALIVFIFYTKFQLTCSLLILIIIVDLIHGILCCSYLNQKFRKSTVRPFDQSQVQVNRLQVDKHKFNESSSTLIDINQKKLGVLGLQMQKKKDDNEETEDIDNEKPKKKKALKLRLPTIINKQQ